mmetsp:Transcript_33042/g.97495  ORF Transcript_33042/g.97495 Transcript_33042/m.97495 type:complete len:236 (+) Transcript_33042:324-1031(+)
MTAPLSNINNYPASVLIIGATGAIGIQILHQLSANPSNPALHALVRDPKKIAAEDKPLYKSIICGNARDAADIERALVKSEAETIVIAVGSGDDLSKSANDIRHANAKAVASVLQDNPQYQHICLVVISSNGAGPTKIKVGMGIGKAIAFHLRHVLRDHTYQEQTLQPLMDRTVILRPTALTDKPSNGAKPFYFGDKEKPPTINISRADVAAVVAEEVCGGTSTGGKTFNLTNAK